MSDDGDNAMEKVLCIMGSPRVGGNSDFAATRIAERLSPAFEVDLVRLPEIELKRCVGCRACMKNGRCAIDDDDFPALWEKTLRADILFQVFPVYWNSPPGIMKDFIDRAHTAYASRGHMNGKSGCLVTVATESGFETADEIAGCWFTAYGGTIRGKVHLLAREKDDLRNDHGETGKLDRLIDQVLSEEARP